VRTDAASDVFGKILRGKENELRKIDQRRKTEKGAMYVLGERAAGASGKRREGVGRGGETEEGN